MNAQRYQNMDSSYTSDRLHTLQTAQLIEIATGAITNLETIQNILDENASRTTTKREANDLGFLVGLP